MDKSPPRRRDVRIMVIKTMFPEFNQYWKGPKKGTILDGRLDSKGNFTTRWTHPVSKRKSTLTVYPSHYKLLGKFFFRKRTE